MPPKSKIARVYDGPIGTAPPSADREAYERDLARAWAHTVVEALRTNPDLLDALYGLLRERSRRD